MVYTKRPLMERMALFWHNHFATAIHKVKDPWLMQQQIRLFQNQALGNFRELVLATAKDPAMLIWLDNRFNVKGKPNENYARELMELHTIGIGHYSEEDVKEAARAFTGWRLERRDQEGYRLRQQELRQQLDQNPSEEQRNQIQRQRFMLERDYPFEFVFRPRQHDDGQKTFLGKTGNFDGTHIIDMLVGMDECADFICRKLFEHFAYDNPEEAVVGRLKAIYFQSGYEIKPIVRAILTSDEFYSNKAYRAQIKSPAEFVVGAARAMEAQTNGQMLAQTMRQLGQVLFDPPSPAGWPGGRAWMNANAVITRSNYAASLASARPGQQGRREGTNYIAPASFLTRA